MVTRIHVDDLDIANQIAEALFTAGHECAVVRERFAGEDDDEAVEIVVATTAEPESVAELIADLAPDSFVTTD